MLFPFAKLTTIVRRPLTLTAAALIFASSLPGAVLNEAAPLFTRMNGPVSIPARVNDRWMFVDAMINDRGPFHLLLDTGCSASVISPAVAAAVNAKPDQSIVTVVNGFGDTSDIPRVVLDSIQLGGARFEGVAAGVTSSLDEFSKIEGRRIDGALGFSLFADVFLTLDFPHQRIELSPDWPADVAPVRAELNVQDNNSIPFVDAQLQGRTVHLEIDTGSNVGLRLPSALVPSFAWKAEPRPGGLVAVLGEGERDWIGRLTGALDVGGIEQVEPVASVSDGGASIGVNFLKSFSVVFDQRHDKMWLCSANVATLPAPPERTVGLSLVADDTGWRVASIVPGSPAEEAHVSPGEIVTKIQGEPARAWSRDRLQAWMDTHDALALQLSGAVGPHDLALRVWSLVP